MYLSNIMSLDNGLTWIFLGLLLLVAFLYASVGHGGASGYLALLVIFNATPVVMKSSALLLNIFVSFIAFFQYYRAGHFQWKIFFPFAVTSVPASFIGAIVPLGDGAYKKILGICLLFSVLRLVGVFGKETDKKQELQLVYALIIGASIGFISGMLGIGGGILLSPVILLLHWANMKETAAVSALFIFVNSISGFLGLLTKNMSLEPHVYVWLLVAITGGFAGAYAGSRRFNTMVLKYVLAFILLIASTKLLLI